MKGQDLRREGALGLGPKAGRIGLIVVLSGALTLLATVIHSAGSGTGNPHRERDTAIVRHSAEKGRKGMNRKTGTGLLQVEIFRGHARRGYGYRIWIGDRVAIDQPHLPAIPGNIGFASEVDARNVADLVVRRIRAGIFPPAVSPEDLDSLGVQRTE